MRLRHLTVHGHCSRWSAGSTWMNQVRGLRTEPSDAPHLHTLKVSSPDEKVAVGVAEQR